MAEAERLTEKILEEARQQARVNIGNAEKEAAALLKAAKEESDRKGRALMEKAEKDASERKKRLIASAELDARKQKLNVKQEIIEEVFRKAVGWFNALPLEQYKNILSNMLVETVGNDNAEIILCKRDRELLGAEFIDSVNAALKARGNKGKLVLSGQTGEFNGGFVLKMGDIEINNSFEAIIKMRRDEFEPEVVKVLF